MSSESPNRDGLSATDTSDRSLNLVTPVALPTPTSQEVVLVRRSEISSLKRGVKRCFENPVESAYLWASVWAGVAASALFSLVALIAVKSNHVSAGVIAGHIAAVIAAGFLATYLAYLGNKNKERTEAAHKDVIADLHELSERAPTQIPDKGVQPSVNSA
jgi:hypothetical protein